VGWCANNAAAQKLRLQDPEARRKFDEWRSFPSEVKHWTRKGYSDEEALVKVAEFQRKQSIKGCNPVTSAKRSAKYSGSKNPMSLASIAAREGVSLRDARQLTPCFGRVGDLHPMFGKKHTPEAIMKIRQHINNSGKSRIEHEMSDRLIVLYGGEKNTYAGGWFCDYVNNDRRLIVEFFGDFWHHNPKLYKPDFVNHLTKRTSDIVWERDARKLAELRALGYHVEVIWESDWRSDSATCMERIALAHDKLLRC
jgi:G:T-mismatch repair DNA endonuclease (very short patch repair protein)